MVVGPHQRCLQTGGGLHDDPLRSLRQSADDQRCPRLDDARLFTCDLLDARTQLRLMVHIDGRDRSDQRLRHVGGVEASAEAHFDDRDVHLLAPEQLERGGSRTLEKRGGHRQCPSCDERVDGRTHAVQNLAEISR